MEELLVNIILVSALILINGYLTAAEIAVVTARKGHIQQMVEAGKRNAKIFLKLKEEPNRLLATIQLGITIVGVLASAIGGITAIQIIKPVLKDVPIKAISAASDPLALGIVVIVISYCTLIFGELVPKSIALAYPETIGLWTAKSIDIFSKGAATSGSWSSIG